MRQATETFHVLQTKQGPESWRTLNSASIYRPAVILAYQSRLIEAIEEAERIRIKNYGDMHGVRFRCVTTTRTVTVASGPFEDAVEEFPRG